MLTAAHGLHLLGGVVALGYVVLQRRAHGARARSGGPRVDVTAIYWHFMDGLWIYIFFLLHEVVIGWQATKRRVAQACTEPPLQESAWGGGGSPFAIGSKKLGMWLFIISDAITFSALLMAYSYVRVASADWPTPVRVLPQPSSRPR